MNSRILVPGVVLAGAVAAAVSLLRTDSAVEVRRLRAELAGAVDVRTLDARLVGYGRYLPLEAPRRGAGDALSLSPELRIAAAHAEEFARDTLSPEAIGLAGEARLLIGDTSDAIDALEMAARDHPDSRTLTALSAAYLKRMDEGGEPGDLARALEFSARATSQSTAPPEAWFDRALACERAALHAAARHAWQEYLRHDDSSAWAAEARAHLAVMRSDPRRITLDASQLWSVRSERDADAVVKDAVQPVREWFESVGAAAWATAVLAHDKNGAESRARTLRLIATALSRRSGDHLPVRLAAELESSSVDLARGVSAYADGVSQYSRNDRADAGASFMAAEAAFTRIGSLWRYWASLQAAVIDYHHLDLARAERRLASIQAAVTGRHWLVLEARLAWLHGIIQMQRGDMRGAVRSYQYAAVLYQSGEEPENAANVFNGTADVLRRLGDRQAGWSQLRHALDNVDRLRDPVRRYLIYFNASLYAARDDLALASVDFQDAAVAAAESDTRSPGAQIEARLRRAAVSGRLDRLESAAADLAAAHRLMPALTDHVQQRYFQATADMVQGELFASRGDAVARIDAALTFFRGAEPAEIPRLLLARAHAEESAGRREEAERSLATAVREYLTRRRELGADDDRVAYLGEGTDLFAELARVRMSLARSDASVFDALEQGRGRTLFEDVRGGAAPQSVTVLSTQLPADVTVVAFSVLPEQLLIWTVTRDRIRQYAVPVDEARLTQLIELLQTALKVRARPPAIARAAADVAKWVVAPWEPAIGPGRRVVLIPDGPLHLTPFALLPVDGRPLVAVHPLSFAPSLNVFCETLHRAGRAPDAPLLIETSGPDAERTHLPRLPDAQREITEIAAVYGSANVLEGSSATRDAVLNGLQHASIVHFAGHAIVDAGSPYRSRLVLAGDADSSSLTERDIAGLDLTGVRLVVLAACRTAGGAVRDGEGVMNLGRPFLAAGVKSIVASLWDLDDAVAATAFARFHRRIHDGESPTAALRDVQLWMAQSSDPALRDPFSWAGLMVIGAGTD